MPLGYKSPDTGAFIEAGLAVPPRRLAAVWQLAGRW
jgi:hypothetical protein